jgi:uncharacterized protein YjbI with pentapeptide repeats
MEGAEVSGEIFDQLDQVSLANSFFENCTFRRCKFIGAAVKHCRFIECSFENCDFSVANVTGSSFRGAKFVECKAVGVNWSLTAGIHASQFISCKLNDTSFSKLDLRHIIFQGCSLENADFRDCRLEKSKFPQSRLSGAQFNKTILVEADFSQAHDYFFDPRENKLKKTKVSLPEAIGLLEALGATLEA